MTENKPSRPSRAGYPAPSRGPRSLTPGQFNALSFAGRLELVRAAQGRQKYDLILEALDAELLVRRLPAQEVFLLIKELGMEDVPELFALVTTGQFTTFLDLDCWQEDLLDPRRALQWLILLLEAGEEKVLRTALEMEFELLALLVKKLVVVTSAPGDLLDEDALAERRLEGVYDVAYRDPAAAGAIAVFLDLLFRRERDFYIRLMEAVRWEEEAELEEEAYRFRRDRLLDHGFPDPVEALSVYAWLDPDTYDPEREPKVQAGPAEEGVEAPSFPLAAAPAGDLLAEVLAGGLDAAACWELTYLINKVMSADRVDVGERAEVQAAVAEVYRTLNLALEHLAGSDPAAAGRLFDRAYLEHLFRAGFSLTLRLQRRARQVAGSRIGPWLDGPFRALVDALGRRRPRFFEGLEDPARAGERPFESLHDLARAEEGVARLEAQRRLFEEGLPFVLSAPGEVDLSGCLPGDPAELTLSDFFLTALANRILGREFFPRPVPQEELAALHARVCREGRVAGELRRETRQWLESVEPGAGAYGDFCLDLWDEEFCAMRPEAIDPRYVSGVIVRLGRS